MQPSSGEDAGVGGTEPARRPRQPSEETQQLHFGVPPEVDITRRLSRPGARPASTYMWLDLHHTTAAFYCPQPGDPVMYLRRVHEEFLEEVGLLHCAPAQRLRHGDQLRTAEPCT